MAIKEQRWLDIGDLRALCMQNHWFTWGVVEEYDKFLYMTKNPDGSRRNMTTAVLHSMAKEIMRFSDPETYERLGVTGIMFCLSERCHSCFADIGLRAEIVAKAEREAAELRSRPTADRVPDIHRR